MKKIPLLGIIVLLSYTLSQPALAQMNKNSSNNNTTTNSMMDQNTTARSDTDIIAEARAKLATDKTISGYPIVVTSNNGVVALKGNVDTDTQASRIIELVSSISGVRDTDTSGLNVKTSNQPFTDTAITAKVKGAYIREKLFGNSDISVMGIKVETVNGVVFLTGTVDTQQQADNAVSLARQISGVKSVNSKVVVNPSR